MFFFFNRGFPIGGPRWDQATSTYPRAMLPTWGSGDAVTDWSSAAIQGAKEAAVGHRIFLVVGTFFHPPEGNTFLVFKRFFTANGVIICYLLGIISPSPLKLNLPYFN